MSITQLAIEGSIRHLELIAMMKGILIGVFSTGIGILIGIKIRNAVEKEGDENE